VRQGFNNSAITSEITLSPCTESISFVACSIHRVCHIIASKQSRSCCTLERTS
jgi:hypothetical protein